MAQTDEKRFAWIWLAPFVIFALAYVLGRTEALQQFEWHTLDWRTQFRALFQKGPDPRIGIVLYEDSTNDNLQPWPPDRAWHGNFNELLALEKPAAVTWDVLFSANREGDGDAKMAVGTQAAIESGTKVIIGAVTSTDAPDIKSGNPGPTRPLKHVQGNIATLEGDPYALPPFPELRAVVSYGFVNAPPSPDGIIREVPMVIRVGDQVYASLTLQTLMNYFGTDTDKVEVKLGDGIYLPANGRVMRIPISKSGRFLLNYRFDQNDVQKDFPTFGYGRLFLTINSYRIDRVPGAPEPPDLKGKILLVGQFVTAKADAGPTPRSSYSPWVLIHANVINNILAEDYAKRVPDWIIWGFALVVGYAGILLLAPRSVLVLAGGSILVGVSYLSLAVWAWVLNSLWFPLVMPVSAFVALQFVVTGRRVLHEQRSKEQVKRMFNSYLSPDLLKKLLKDKGMAMGGERKSVTILFSDLRDFTAWSEKTKEEVLIAQLNEYLGAMVECIHEQGGPCNSGWPILTRVGLPPVSIPSKWESD